MIANEKVLICNTLTRFSFAGSFAEMQTSASVTNAFCLQFSLHVQLVLQTLCKGNIFQYQAHANSFVCRFVCRNLKLTEG